MTKFYLFLISIILEIPLVAQTQAAVAVNEHLTQSQPQQQSFSASKICPSDLETAINRIINQPKFQRSRWGILIETASSKTTLYSRDANSYFIPASVVKLLTTAVALQKLGADFRIRTSVYGDGKGTVYLVGRGDPTITETQLKSIAQQLKNQGITQINNLIVDDGYFQGLSIHPSWQWEDVQAGYGAPINSLILNQNSLDLILSPQNVGQPLKVTWVRSEQGNGWQIENNSVTVNQNQAEFVEIGRDLTKPIIRISGQLRMGSEPEPVYAAVVEPAENFLQGFKAVLEAEGISVQQASVQRNTQPPSQEIAYLESPPLAELIQEVNLESNNIFAESLLRTLGRLHHQDDALGQGLQEITSTLTQMGINRDSYFLYDGSGLSRQNLVSPETLVTILSVMANSPVAEIYRQSLPVAAEKGTLKSRFQGTPAAGIVQAKTGTLTGVSSLAGYISPPNYEPLIFTIIVNQTALSYQELRQAIDEVVLTLTQLQTCL